MNGGADTARRGEPVPCAPPPFEPGLHISPFALFRALADGRDVRLWRLAGQGGEKGGFRAEIPYPGQDEAVRTLDRRPVSTSATHLIVLVDTDGREAAAEATALNARLPGAVLALYGGLALYRFALDPLVVGAERFLNGAPGGEIVDPASGQAGELLPE